MPTQGTKEKIKINGDVLTAQINNFMDTLTEDMAQLFQAEITDAIDNVIDDFYHGYRIQNGKRI